MSPDPPQRGSAVDRRTAPELNVADQGPRAQAAKGLVDSIAHSPHMAAQQSLVSRIHDSPRMAVQRQQLGRQPVQLTIYKIASSGPERHENDPKNYAERTGDALEPKSLHEYKPGEIDLAVATSPITIFIHGSTLASLTARKFYAFLEKRGYKPKPDTEIVFITCHGAMQIDEFLVEKGQALADLLGATVHLAKGIVRINTQGVPIVEKPDSPGNFEHITSKEEFTRIVPKETEGWKSYKPQGITHETVQDEIRLARGELRKYAELKICEGDTARHQETLGEILNTLKLDRRELARFYKVVQDIRQTMREKFQPRLAFVEKLGNTIKSLQQAKTTKHGDRAKALAAEYTGWAESVAAGRGSLEGFELLYQDKKAEWLDPFYRDIEHEDVERGIEAWGLNDDFLDELSLEEDTPEKTVVPSKTDSSKTGKEAIQYKSGQSRSVLQAKISGGATKLHSRTVLDILQPLTDIGLVRGNDGIDLLVELAPLDKGTHGLTSVWVDGTRINPHVDIVPETAPKTTYTIKIQLSDAREIDEGSMYYTLAHEWELHGLQHARNIARAKAGSNALDRIDHVELFNPASTDMDTAIAQQILSEKSADVRQQIFNAYLRDVFAHIIHLQADWLIKKKADLNVQALIGDVKSAVDTLNSMARYTVQDSPWATVVRAAALFAKQHADDLKLPKVYVRPTDLPISARAVPWIKTLAACAETRPPKNEVLETWFEVFARPGIRKALIYLHELADYLALPPVTRIDMSAEDDKEAWKLATLLPRMQSLAKKGVDVVALNSKLNLREEGAEAAAHDGPVNLPESSAPRSTAASTLEFLQTDWDALFLEKWKRREVEFIPADKLAELFDEDEAAKFTSMGDGRVTDKYRNKWIVQHLDDQRHIYYLKVGWT